MNNTEPLITPTLCRAGRAKLRMDQGSFCFVANVDQGVMRKFENNQSVTVRSRLKIIDAFAKHGVRFMILDGGKTEIVSHRVERE